MTSTERKRAWRERHPERSREAERRRAQARRDRYWALAPGEAPQICRSSDSYWRYESSTARYRQRLFYPRYGAGAHQLSREEFRAAGLAVIAPQLRAGLALIRTSKPIILDI